MIRANEKLPSLLIKKAEQISNATELLLSKTKDWQVIKQYLCNRLEEIKLTTKQQEKLERYQFIYNQLISGKWSQADVISAVVKLYNIKINQAYEDMVCTQEIFTSVLNINKRFELNVELQINRNMLRKAEELCDLRAYAQLEKNRVLLLAQIPDEEENPAEFFEGHAWEATFDPTLIGAEDIDMKEVLTQINSKRKTKIKTEMFADIEHEDVNDQAAPL